MKHTSILASGAALIAAAMVHNAAAQAPLPAAIQADRAVVSQDGTNLHNAFAQLKADEQAGNSAALAADHSAAQLARMQARADFGKLHQDALGILQPDETALMAALTQLHADQVANNAGALQADQTAVQSAKDQFKADRKAVFGDLGLSMHHRGWQG